MWRWGRFGTVRFRTTAMATLIVAIMIGLASVLLVGLLHRALIKNLDDQARAQIDEISRDVARQTFGSRGDGLFQIIDGDGNLVASSPSIDDPGLFATLNPSGSSFKHATLEDLPLGDDDTFRVAVKRLEPDDFTVYVAQSVEPIERTISTLQGALGLGAPLLLAFLTLTTWLVVGRALEPVDGIRNAVDVISDDSLHVRVPVPGPEDEVRRLALTMNKMLDRLEVSAERQSRFVADASHELQTPLASIRADLETAIERPDGADWGSVARDLLATNIRMENLVRDLLYLARSDDGHAPPMTPVDLDDVVLEEVTRIRRSAPVSIEVKEVSGAEVQGRRSDLERMVRNLLDNACTHATARVVVKLASENGETVLSISDDGPGIPQIHHEEVFRRFRRLEEGPSSTGGTGLGLSIVRSIVEDHGGSVSVEDAIPGARFVVRFPAGGHPAR